MSVSVMFDLIRSGKGFSNPIRTRVSSAMNSISIPSLEVLSALAATQASTQGVPVPSTNEINNAHEAIVTAYNKATYLLSHSDRISGVDMTGDNTLAAISRTMQSTKNINGDKTCARVLGAFGTLMKAAEMVSSTIDMVSNIKNLLEDIPGNIATIPGKLQSYSELIINQVGSDLSILAAAQIDNIQHAMANNIASLFSDPCIGQVLGTVMTNDLKNLAKSVMQTEIEKTRKAITGR